MRNWIKRFAKDRRGIAAVEFAFIAPVLLILYFVSMEVSQAIETNKKVSRIGSMVADLVTQQSGEISKNDLEAIMQIGGAILQPYGRSNPRIVVTGIHITDESDPKAKVTWSRQMVSGLFSKDLDKDTIITTLPKELKIRNTFLIQVSGQLDYRPVIAWTAQQKAALGLAAAFDNIPMTETYYLRPRMSDDIVCKGC